MSREKEAYRDNLELLIEFFGDKKVLTIKDVCRYTKHCYRYCIKHYPFKNGEISIATLARVLS